MDKLLKLKKLLLTSGHVNVDEIITSCAFALLSARAQQEAKSVMESWSVDELKACVQKAPENTMKALYSKAKK